MVLLEKNKPRCVEMFLESPCLKKFIKTGQYDYRLICGKKVDD